MEKISKESAADRINLTGSGFEKERFADELNDESINFLAATWVRFGEEEFNKDEISETF